MKFRVTNLGHARLRNTRGLVNYDVKRKSKSDDHGFQSDGPAGEGLEGLIHPQGTGGTMLGPFILSRAHTNKKKNKIKTPAQGSLPWAARRKHDPAQCH